MRNPAIDNRITNIDVIRGVAVLAIPIMNVVSYGLPPAAYYNLSAGGSLTAVDWLIGIAGEIFIDQKAMGLFSMLFGAGIVFFADRVAAKGGSAIGLSLWRNVVLFGFGVLHSLLWIGDVLVVYALCAPFLIACRRANPGLLLATGVVLTVSPVLLAGYAHSLQLPVDALGEFWLTYGSEMSAAVLVYVLGDAFLRAAGMMLVGVALYRYGIVQGGRSDAVYRRLALYGLGLGLPLAACGTAIQLWSEFSAELALLSEIPNTLATLPATLGYLGCITLWCRKISRTTSWRFEAVGRMALTNYISQTIIGLLVLDALFGNSLDRSGLALFVLLLAAAQIIWSNRWLARHRYGPLEWLWRSATYRRWQANALGAIA